MIQDLINRASFLQKWQQNSRDSDGSALSALSSQEFMGQVATMAEDSIRSNGSNSSFHTAATSMGRADTNGEADALVKDLTNKVEGLDDDTVVSLTAREIRLLLGLPDNQQRQSVKDCSRRRRSTETSLPRLSEVESESSEFNVTGASVPPTVIEPTDTSNLFTMWDFTSKEKLSADEIQAVMIALAAENQQRWEGQENDGLEEDDDIHSSRPSPLSSREVSIQSLLLDDDDSTNNNIAEFLVTLGGTTTTTTSQPAAKRHSRKLRRQTEIRQLTIQSEEEKKTDDLEATAIESCPDILAGRQVSVRPVQAHEEGSILDVTQFVVTFSDSSSSSTQSTPKGEEEEVPPPPRPLSSFSSLARQLSIQPAPFDGPFSFQGGGGGNPFSDEEETMLMMPVPALTRPGMMSERQVSVRVNGNPKPVSFRVHGL
ncbi:expressed unknown protein [Seminavis robusta]|uniref:Uncharacterized protein n=1 Tax=Seminavis robusta TaxID=568900 RepID=A0A9N8D8U2_9STRA|nr:expressed unknown protein [Seminavis robusta]|eukprot:Sro18_g012670.1 n/a (429) ;mRNA; r:3807-5093